MRSLSSRSEADQVIAILDFHNERKAALAEAEEQVKVAQAGLAVIQAGAKSGEIKAQQAEIERLTAERQGNTSKLTHMSELTRRKTRLIFY